MAPRLSVVLLTVEYIKSSKILSIKTKCYHYFLRDEHEDWREEMDRQRAARGKVKWWPKGSKMREKQEQE